jgi:hypothetical protein
MFWYLGEDRFVYTEVSSELGQDFEISSSNYTIYDVNAESIVASGIASISGAIVFAEWVPSGTGLYAIDFKYSVGTEQYISRQVVEVRETM